MAAQAARTKKISHRWGAFAKLLEFLLEPKTGIRVPERAPAETPKEGGYNFAALGRCSDIRRSNCHHRREEQRPPLPTQDAPQAIARTAGRQPAAVGRTSQPRMSIVPTLRTVSILRSAFPLTPATSLTSNTIVMPGPAAIRSREQAPSDARLLLGSALDDALSPIRLGPSEGIELRRSTVASWLTSSPNRWLTTPIIVS